MLKCKTCKYFKKCVIDCKTVSGDPSCSKHTPHTSPKTIPNSKPTSVEWDYDSMARLRSVQPWEGKTGEMSSKSSTGISDTGITDTSILEKYFKDIIPVLKEQVPVEDKAIIEKITYIIRNLGHIIGKSESEDIFREELFINLIHEDFEINQALDHAILKIENSIKSRGIEVGFDSAKIYKIADIVTEIRMIYKLILACGLSGYANEIMSHVIAAKFTLRQTQVLKEKK